MKSRYEYKYMLDAMQDIYLRSRVENALLIDANAGKDGVYNIRSLYFDDEWDTCVYDNESAIDPRRKFRIRIYNGSREYISLEKKSKICGMTVKESSRLSEEECYLMMKGDISSVLEKASANKEDKKVRLLVEMINASMQPKIIVSYDRVPFVYPAGNVRVTFDRDISCTYDIETFLNHEVFTRPIMRTGWQLMEVKWDEIMPSFIKQLLQTDELKWTGFSKYYLCRKYNTLGGL